MAARRGGGIVVRDYYEALRFARACGEDSANRRMRKAGRKIMSRADYNHAVDVMEKFLFDLGYDTRGWMAMAGLPRNEPPEPKAARKPRKRSAALGLAPQQQQKSAAPVQLSFAFA